MIHFVSENFQPSVDVFEILRQLTNCRNSASRLLELMLGTTFYSDLPNGVEFDFKMCRKYNRCRITYNEGNDLYDMEFFRRTRNGDEKNSTVVKGIFNDMLSCVFEENTGLSCKKFWR